MAHVQVRDLPEDVHAELVRRAERAGTSLQQYLFAELVELVRTPTLDDLIDRIEGRTPPSNLSSEDALAALGDERDRR
ncbi:MAG: hypothetical protein GEV08_12585 [Acidimicrobiia bacterium]|nr:hypothetical protein [Acidimicrobiia bacterium]